MITVTTNNFENDVLHADKPVLLDFWARGVLIVAGSRRSLTRLPRSTKID